MPQHVLEDARTQTRLMVSVVNGHIVWDASGSQLVVEIQAALRDPDILVVGAVVDSDAGEAQQVVPIPGYLSWNVAKTALPATPDGVVAQQVAIGLAVEIVEKERRVWNIRVVLQLVPCRRYSNLRKPRAMPRILATQRYNPLRGPSFSSGMDPSVRASTAGLGQGAYALRTRRALKPLRRTRRLWMSSDSNAKRQSNGRGAARPDPWASGRFQQRAHLIVQRSRSTALQGFSNG